MLRVAIALLCVSCATDPPGVGVEQKPTPDAAADTSGWREYRSAEYQFTLRYPPAFVVVPATDDPEPGVVARVWFQDRSIAASEVARVSPPQFAVDVYGNRSRQSLDAWLSSRRLPDPARFAREPVLVGGVDGIRLTGSAQLAPNVFYFVARGDFVYRFTPLGGEASGMLSTVRFGG